MGPIKDHEPSPDGAEFDWSGGAPDEPDPTKPKPLLPALGHEIGLYRTDSLSRPQWKDLRRVARTIGASNIAGIMQRNPYSTPIQEWCKITGRGTEDEVSDPEERFRTDLGIVVETQIHRLAAEAIGVQYVAVDLRSDNCMVPWPQVLQHPTIPCMTCNLDVVAVQDWKPMPTECKWSGWRSREAWYELRDTLDPYSVVGTLVFAYYLQVQAQLSITGLHKGILIGIIGEDAANRMLLTVATGTETPYPPHERDIVVVYVERDDKIIADIEQVAQRFHAKYIATDKMPPVWDNRDLAALRAAYREANPPKVSLDRPDLAPLCERYLAIGSKVAHGKKLQDDTKTKILHAIVESEVASMSAGPYKITYKPDTRGQRSLRITKEKDA